MTTTLAPADLLRTLRTQGTAEVRIFTGLAAAQRAARTLNDEALENFYGEALQEFADTTTLTMDAGQAEREAYARLDVAELLIRHPR